MVKAGLTLLAVVPATLLAYQGFALDLPAYRMGDVATNDVITTTRLSVVDQQATAELRKQEASKIPLFVVYSTNQATFAESEVELAIARMREEFLALLQASYGTHRLTPDVVQSEGFEDLVEQTVTTSPVPPVPRQLLLEWGRGREDLAFLEEWFAPLRRVMNVPITTERLPGGGRVPGNMRLQLALVDDLRLFVKEESALSNSVTSFGSNLVSLAAARSELRAAYPRKDSPVTEFMVGQLQPNCRFDTNLTRRVKDLAVSGLVRMNHLEPGEAVIREGQVIDEQALAVLAEMHRHLKVLSLEKQVAVDEVAVRLLGERSLWLAGLLVVTVLVLVLVLVRAHRRRRHELVPVLSSSLVHQSAECEEIDQPTIVDVPPADEGQWRRRALEAEQRVAQAKALARSSLMPHLAQQLKDNAVQELAEQVDEMLAVQAAVTEQMVTLEDRLERIHAPLQERLRTYEERISELELELAQRGQENQVLLRARIEALRRQMAEEQARAGTGVS